MANLPQRAQERIQRMVSSPNPLFTSTLTTNETVIAGADGPQADQPGHGVENLPRRLPHVLEVVAVGTGVARIDDASHETHEPPKAVIFAHDARAVG